MSSFKFACILVLALAGAVALADINPAARKLTAYSGTSSYPGGYTQTTDNGNGTSTTCTVGQYYSGCHTYPNGDGAGRKLLAYSGCSTWSTGSTCTTNNGNGTSTVCTKDTYYNGCSTYPNGE